jgi:two-component system, chemotaxis family, CheB/CheR fusion protein
MAILVRVNNSLIQGFRMSSRASELKHVTPQQREYSEPEAEMASRSETEIQASRLAAIVESSDDAIASKDLNGIVTSWNASAERIFGYKAEEIIGKPITLIIPPELRSDEDMILGKIARGERIHHFETVRLTRSGERIDVSLSISPVRNASGKVVGASKIVRDITDRKRTEEALRRAEKLAATGQLAASIAHEINNPMQALTNLVALISYKTSLDETTRQLVSLAETEVKRMAHIVRQMLSFYRESPRPASVKITEVLEDAFELFMMRMSSNQIKVERRYEFTGEVYGFPVELRQLFANLISNAIEAIGTKGHIYIHVAPWREPVKPERQGVRVVIADNGLGIRPEFRKRIFEPFFTTKAEKGTGLGLWVVKGIVSRHEGSIRMRTCTDPGRSGTIFSVFLPLQTPPQAEFPELPRVA